MSVRRLLFLLFVLAVPAFAQDPWCGTDAATSQRVHALHRANRVAALAAPAVENRGGIFVVPQSPANAVGERRNDLAGKSVRFVPVTPDTYRTTVEPLQYDDNIGTVVKAFSSTTSSDWFYAKADLKTPLTLFGGSARTLYLTAFNGITLTQPRSNAVYQLDALEAAFLSEPTIAPLLMANNRPYPLGLPTVWMREGADGVLVTWRTTTSWGYDVQAKISPSGEILFSYRRLSSVTWGAVVVTPGSGRWASAIAQVAQGTDDANDVTSETPAAQRGILDLRSMTIAQVPDAGVYLMTIAVAAPLASAVSRGDDAVYTITFDDGPPIAVSLAWNNGVQMSVPGRTLPYGNTAGFQDNHVNVAFTSDTIGTRSGPRHVAIESALGSMQRAADRLTADVELQGGRVPGVDLVAASGSELPLPIVDAFTLPALDLESVWESVRAAGKLDDANVDAVAIFQNFPTDIILHAGAFASGGNDGSDGVTKFAQRGSAWPRSPTLLHMNMTNYSNNQDLAVAGRTLMHEFGHRWLQFVETMVDGSRTLSLNPAPAHPPQFASTPAAFPVKGPYDTSTMGGGLFAQSGNTFTSAEASPYGYSWLDLYLMGLASASEVPPSYWIDQANPPLAVAYTPPSNVTVTGIRRDVAMQQVLDAMGRRTPSVATSQRTFKVVFVLIASPDKAPDADVALVDQYRRAFEDNFVKATGQRGYVQTLFWAPQPRRRAVEW